MKPDNPPVFPICFNGHNKVNEGILLRDWLAGQALAAMTTAPDYSKGPCNAALAERAYLISDLMLLARAKTSDQPPTAP